MTPFSVLDLSPILQADDIGRSLRNSRDLAHHAETWGYQRFWMAEHHNLGSVASAATSVCLAYVAEGTSTIRLGAGGVMLPNHAPLVIAEQFGTLASLYPGRIDLGVGRAPGTDQMTAQALRRTLSGSVDRFPQDVVELMHYFEPARPQQAVVAIPGAGTNVPVWILGSSTYGAQLAAHLGLPYAFASHFAPGQMDEAIAIYRQAFQPSKYLDKPYLMLGLQVIAADTDEEARYLLTSVQQSYYNLRTGNPGPLPPPVDDIDARLPPEALASLRQTLSIAAVGSPETVRQKLAAFLARTGADELMITGQIHDHAARLRSFEIAAQAREALASAV